MASGSCGRYRVFLKSITGFPRKSIEGEKPRRQKRKGFVAQSAIGVARLFHESRQSRSRLERDGGRRVARTGASCTEVMQHFIFSDAPSERLLQLQSPPSASNAQHA